MNMPIFPSGVSQCLSYIMFHSLISPCLPPLSVPSVSLPYRSSPVSGYRREIENGFWERRFSCGCQPDGFLIVLKGSWAHRLTQTAQFGKQWITQATQTLDKLKGECRHHLKLSLSVLCFSTCVFSESPSAEWELVYCIPCLSGLSGREGGGRQRGWEGDIDWNMKTFI